FGGCSGDSTDGVWALSLGDTPTWARLATTGLSPAGCSEPAAEYDPVRDRMVVMTGGDQVRTWGLSLSGTPAWSELSPSGVPNSRPEVSAIYDPTLDRVVMFGNDSEGHQDDVWSLSLSPQLTWTALRPVRPFPPVNFKSATIFDPPRDRIVLFTPDGV